jgi:oligopeptide/dipeptide ABC transporter ATP-binding protein
LSVAEELLSILGLKTYFNTFAGAVKAVDGINLKIHEKEAVGLVGESGCGKTTAAFSILRLVQPPGKIIEGKILYKGENLLEVTEEEMRRIRGKEISLVFQDPLNFLNPVLKIESQIGEAIQSSSGKRARAIDVKGEVIKALESVGIPSPSNYAQCYPHQLSGGMRQRVVIATCLIGNPSLLIADEPTTALDVTVQAQILNLLKDLKEKLKFSVLLITHDLGIVADVCDRVYVMYAGKIVENADVFTLYENCKHPYTIGLLKSVLSINEFKENLIVLEGTAPNLLNLPPGCRFHPRCRNRKEICQKQEPPSVEVDKGHVVSCWLYAED